MGWAQLQIQKPELTTCPRVQSENRKSHKTEEEKHQFTCASFQLDTNEKLNADEKLKEAVIK